MDLDFAQWNSGIQPSAELALPCFHSTTEPSGFGFCDWHLNIDVLFQASADQAQAFKAYVTAYHFNRFLLCTGYQGRARYCRDSARLGWCDLDHFLVHVPLQRGLVSADGLRVRPHDVVVLDLAQPARFSVAAGQGTSVLIPRLALSMLLPDASGLHGRVLRRESGSGALLARLLVALAAAAPRLAIDDALRLAKPVLGMVAACLAGAGGSSQPGGAAMPADLGRRMRLYIEQNLHRPDLTPAFLSKALGASRSQLYRAFERFGGIRKYILGRRLRRCLFALCDTSNAGRRIGDLAFDHGFVDEAHFSRLFRKAFGMAPGVARKAAQRGELAGFSGLASQPCHPGGFAQWVRELTGS